MKGVLFFIHMKTAQQLILYFEMHSITIFGNARFLINI